MMTIKDRHALRLGVLEHQAKLDSDDQRSTQL
jgi:hypothetical protein